MTIAARIALLDLRRWMKSRTALVAAILPPLVMVAFILALTASVGRQPVALVVMDHGAQAQRMVDLISSDDEAYRLVRTNTTEATRLLHSQTVAAVIVIPPDFGTRVAHADATLNLTLNNIDIDFADDIRRAVDRSVAQFDAPALGIVGERREGAEAVPNPYRIAIQEHSLRDTTVSFTSYQLLPAIVLAELSIGILGTAFLLTTDVEARRIKLYVMSPASRGAVIAGRLLGGTLLTLGVVLPLVAVGAWRGVVAPEDPSHWPAVLGLLVGVGVTSVAFGLLLGVWLRSSPLVVMAATIVSSYLFFLGGGFTTIAFLPSWLQHISTVVPTRYAIDGFREALFYPDLDGVAKALLVLAGTSLVLAAASVVSLRRVLR